MSNVSDPILIVSAPRSGSSLLSYILSCEGVQCGITKEGDEYNPNGYFENLQIRELVIRHLHKNDVDKLGKRYQPINLDFSQEEAELFRNNVIASMKSQGVDISKPWLFKDPKIALVWKLFAQAFPNAKWVLLHRRVDDILNSFRRAKFMDAYKDTTEWLEYLDRFHENMQTIENECKNTHSFRIESIFDNRDADIERLFESVNLKNTKKYLTCAKTDYFKRT